MTAIIILGIIIWFALLLLIYCIFRSAEQSAPRGEVELPKRNPRS